MGVLNCFKAMNIEASDDKIALLRTTRSMSVFGSMFLITGVAILVQLLCPNCKIATMFGLCVICLLTALVFVVTGLVMVSYHKIVKIDKASSKIELIDSSIIGIHQSAIHFCDISEVEISRDAENIFGDESDLWVARVYISRFGKDGMRHFYKTEKIFASQNIHEVREVADMFSNVQNLVVVDRYVEESTSKLAFAHAYR